MLIHIFTKHNQVSHEHFIILHAHFGGEVNEEVLVSFVEDIDQCIHVREDILGAGED